MKKRNSWRHLSAFICALMLMVPAACGYAAPSGELVIYNAGILASLPLFQLGLPTRK